MLTFVDQHCLRVQFVVDDAADDFDILAEFFKVLVEVVACSLQRIRTHCGYKLFKTVSEALSTLDDRAKSWLSKVSGKLLSEVLSDGSQDRLVDDVPSIDQQILSLNLSEILKKI